MGGEGSHVCVQEKRLEGYFGLSLLGPVSSVFFYLNVTLGKLKTQFKKLAGQELVYRRKGTNQEVKQAWV